MGTIKKAAFFIILILLLGYAALGRNQKSSEETTVVVKEAPNEKAVVEPVMVSVGGKDYGIYFQEIKNNLELIPNFSEKKSSEKIFSENKCLYGANGGFYKKEGGAHGLFAVEGKIIGKEIESETFNGYFWKKYGDMGIDWSKPEGWKETDFIIQSGPIFEVGYTGKGKFVDEEERRRVLAVNDKSGKFYFVVMFEKYSIYGGPKLSQMAEILRESKIAEFDRAINLDGGSASAFYGENGAKLWEIANVGSFFCGK